MIIIGRPDMRKFKLLKDFVEFYFFIHRYFQFINCTKNSFEKIFATICVYKITEIIQLFFHISLSKMRIVYSIHFFVFLFKAIMINTFN